jgi:hypothetical protein
MTSPSLDGFDVKVVRAGSHLQVLRDENERIARDRLYTFRGEILDRGLVHLYRVQNPPPADPQWSAIIGDCLHNLRSALDYLAWQLVLASGSTPTSRTGFPIRHKRADRAAMAIDGLANATILKVVESLQPYHGLDVGTQLGRLHRLDIADKHRQLLVAAAVPRAYGYDFNPALHPVSSLNLTYHRLREISGRHDEAIFEVRFTDPVDRLTLNMNPIPMIAFSHSEPDVGGLDADRVLTELHEALQHNVRPLFVGFLS